VAIHPPQIGMGGMLGETKDEKMGGHVVTQEDELSNEDGVSKNQIILDKPILRQSAHNRQQTQVFAVNKIGTEMSHVI
jgi:hypothetical protein